MDCSFVIPAYNEEFFIPKTLNSLKSAIAESKSFNKWEIIVVDNCSDDRTAEIAAELNAIVVHEPVRQIARARNSGAAKALGEILIFLDADTPVGPDTLIDVRNALSSGRVFGGGSVIQFDDHQNKYFLGSFIPFLWNLFSKAFNFGAGSFIFCTKKDFILSGGFPETVYAGEEIGFIQKLKKIHRKSKRNFVILTNHPVVTSPSKLSWYSNWQITLYMLLVLFFPLSIRFRKLCGFWYKRPVDRNG